MWSHDLSTYTTLCSLACSLRCCSDVCIFSTCVDLVSKLPGPAPIMGDLLLMMQPRNVFMGEKLTTSRDQCSKNHTLVMELRPASFNVHFRYTVLVSTI